MVDGDDQGGRPAVLHASLSHQFGFQEAARRCWMESDTVRRKVARRNAAGSPLTAVAPKGEGGWTRQESSGFVRARLPALVLDGLCFLHGLKASSLHSGIARVRISPARECSDAAQADNDRPQRRARSDDAGSYAGSSGNLLD